MSPQGKRVAVAGAALALAGVYAVGASSISGEAGYGGVGPNFLPWVVSLVLALCGGALLWQSIKGRWPEADTDGSSDAVAGANLGAFAWVSAGLLANAALIQSLGFIISCALCFALAARGFRIATEVRASDLKSAAFDFGLGAAIAAPVFWMFTLALNVNLPGLTKTGWL